MRSLLAWKKRRSKAEIRFAWFREMSAARTRAAPAFSSKKLGKTSMADHPSVGLKGDEASPLHELISQILVSDESSQGGEASRLPMLGTMQQLNQRLANQPGLDFIRNTLKTP